ncbi:MAG: hypothetical protein K2X73_04725 [Sphingomonas sp.]|uniref:hypothetical protein n=1 Tax=Sphingomonas sp. TaxID=28214 RepID=UPI0025D0B432|nr:hypothetical protein [Sphingomonas sp.]MBX9881258.1 hypothetical protein [Sphingomonas sp.]
MPSFPRVAYAIYTKKEDGTRTTPYLTYSAAEALEMLQTDPTLIAAGATGKAMTTVELQKHVSMQAMTNW